MICFTVFRQLLHSSAWFSVCIRTLRGLIRTGCWAPPSRVPDSMGVRWEWASAFLASLQGMLILMLQGAHREDDCYKLSFSKSEPQILKSQPPELPSNLQILRTHPDSLNPGLRGVVSVICILSSSPGGTIHIHVWEPVRGEVWGHS